MDTSAVLTTKKQFPILPLHQQRQYQSLQLQPQNTTSSTMMMAMMNSNNSSSSSRSGRYEYRHAVSDGSRSSSNSPQSLKRATSHNTTAAHANIMTTTTSISPRHHPRRYHGLAESVALPNPQDDNHATTITADYHNTERDHPPANAFSTTQQYRRNGGTGSSSSGTGTSWWLFGGAGGGGSHHYYHPQNCFTRTTTMPIMATNNMTTMTMPSCWATFFWFVMIAGGLVMGYASRYSLVDSMEEVIQLRNNGYKLQGKLGDAEKGIHLLQRRVSAYDAMIHNDNNNKHHSSSAASDHDRVMIPTTKTTAADPKLNPTLYAHQRALEEMQQLSSRLQVSQQKADKLKDQVQRLSKTEAIERYGDQIHRVELELAFPDRREGPTRLVIELAPIDVMPHSVHFFLEVVSSGLLDGCSFILNALHVLKAAPLPYDGSSAANKARAFTRMGLESVAFKEYAPSYPHEQYTVGFAADGSPSFYINTEDNSEIHLGDPCFGKIVEGFDTVKRLEASPTRNGIWFEQRIGIKRATVLS